MSEATATEPTAPDASIVMESKPGISVGDFDPPRPSRFDAYGRNGVPFPFPCRVVDADGNVIGPCREADLETGSSATTSASRRRSCKGRPRSTSKPSAAR